MLGEKINSVTIYKSVQPVTQLLGFFLLD